YKKQKSALERQLSVFLAALSPPKDVSSASSVDIVKFLISKDAGGRTTVHVQGCERRGRCECPRRLASGTVDSLLGKLRAIYNAIGRTNDSNPVAHQVIKDYLKFIRASGVAVVPEQAVPLFF
ncbi:predicted protein, partial [Nematostella vectensis]